MVKNAIEDQFQLANVIPYTEKRCFQHCSWPSYISEKSSPFSPQTTPVTLLTEQHLGLLFLHFSLRRLPGRLKCWSILSTAPLASANSHLSLKSCVYTLPANSNTLLPDTEVSFLESMHQYPDGRHHHRSIVPEKGSLPIPIVYRGLQPWMDYSRGSQFQSSCPPALHILHVSLC